MNRALSAIFSKIQDIAARHLQSGRRYRRMGENPRNKLSWQVTTLVPDQTGDANYVLEELVAEDLKNYLRKNRRTVNKHTVFTVNVVMTLLRENGTEHAEESGLIKFGSVDDMMEMAKLRLSNRYRGVEGSKERSWPIVKVTCVFLRQKIAGGKNVVLFDNSNVFKQHTWDPDNTDNSCVLRCLGQKLGLSWEEIAEKIQWDGQPISVGSLEDIAKALSCRIAVYSWNVAEERVDPMADFGEGEEAVNLLYRNDHCYLVKNPKILHRGRCPDCRQMMADLSAHTSKNCKHRTQYKDIRENLGGTITRVTPTGKADIPYVFFSISYEGVELKNVTLDGVEMTPEEFVAELRKREGIAFYHDSGRVVEKFLAVLLLNSGIRVDKHLRVGKVSLKNLHTHIGEPRLEDWGASSLLEVFDKYREAVLELFGVDPLNFTSLSATAWNCFRTTLKHEILLPSEECMEACVASIVGGRMFHTRGIVQDACLLDVTSLYPTAMKMNNYPVGKELHVVSTDIQKALLLRTPTLVHVSVIDRPELCLSLQKYEREWMWSDQLNFMHSLGYRFACSEYYTWKESGDVYDNYITKVFNLKKNSEGSVRQVAKLLLNSVYGKTLCRTKTKKLIVTTLDEMHAALQGNVVSLLPLPNSEALQISVEVKSKETKPLHHGSYILNKSQQIMNRFFDTLDAWHNERVYYSHTDSLLISKEHLPLLTDCLGSDLGELDCKELDTAIVLRSNAYYLREKDGKEKVCVGGLVRRLAEKLTEEDFLKVYSGEHPLVFEYQGVKRDGEKLSEVTYRTKLE